MKECFDVAIIGGGPAGIAASIQLKRYGLDIVLIEKYRIGGSLLNANLIENYLGFPSIKGRELVELIEKQLKINEVKVIFSEAKQIYKEKDYFEIELEEGNIYSKCLIVATGLIPKKLGLPGEEELFKSKKLFYEIKYLGEIKNKIFVIIGSGDVAFDYALSLSKDNKVVILCKDSPKCIPPLKKRVDKVKNINIFTEKATRLCSRREKVWVECKSGKIIECNYIIVAIGKRRNLMLKDKGVFLAGDLKMGEFRQLGIAVGDGLLAAMKVKRYLEERK